MTGRIQTKKDGTSKNRRTYRVLRRTIKRPEHSRRHHGADIPRIPSPRLTENAPAPLTRNPWHSTSASVLASSNPGDLVLDPFAGCATTIMAAQQNGRRWVGIDRRPDARFHVVCRMEGIKAKDAEDIRNLPHLTDWLDARLARHDARFRTEPPVQDRLRQHRGPVSGCGPHRQREVHPDPPRDERLLARDLRAPLLGLWLHRTRRAVSGAGPRGPEGRRRLQPLR